MDIFYEILKWIFLVLVAGFVSHFGRSFSQYLIKKRISKKKEMAIPLTKKEQKVEAKQKKKETKTRLKEIKKNESLS